MAAFIESVVVSCGGCREEGNLRCRFSTGRDVFEVPGEYDEEAKVVCCVVPRERVVPGLTYELLANGRVLCRNIPPLRPEGQLGKGGGLCCAADGNDTSTVKCCDPPEVLRPCKDPGGQGFSARSLTGPAEDTKAVLQRLSWLDRLLPLWIIVAMVVGVLLGVFAPSVRRALGVAEVAGGVSLPIALGLWVMMLPVLAKVRYELLVQLARSRGMLGQFGVSFALNWVVGPALMVALAWACLPDLPSWRNGVIMVGLARCIAMVFIWNDLAAGHAELCAVMVAFNSVLQIILYAPLSIFYIQTVSGGSSVYVGFWPVAKSVLLFLGVPLVAGVIIRYGLISIKGRRWFDARFMPWFGPWALIGLLYTIIVMFAAQGDRIVHEIVNVVRVAVPMLLYFNLMFVVSLALSWRLRMSYAFSVTQAFTAASNNFELAIAVAVGTFGIQSPEALAATVGPLIEVPVLLALVYVALWVKRRWWDARDAAHAVEDANAIQVTSLGSAREGDAIHMPVASKGGSGFSAEGPSAGNASDMAA